MTEHLSQQRRTDLSSYPTERPPSVQPVLDALATIEIEHENDIQTVQDSSVDSWLKQATISNLSKHCHERQGPFLRRLAALHEDSETLPE